MKSFFILREQLEAKPEAKEVVEAESKNDMDPQSHLMVSLLKNLVQDAEELMGMIQSDSELPEWCHAKITLAQDYVETVSDYLKGESE
jgi:hypothetical protein